MRREPIPTGVHTAREALLERDPHLVAADAALEAVMAGQGQTLLIRGPAGIGKTVLLEEIAKRAQQRRFAVHEARADDLASSLPYGVLLQLFASSLSRLDREAEAALSEGPAAYSIDLLRGSSRGPAPEFGDPPSVAVHGYGFYWLLQELAEIQPRMLCIDDAHWSDPASLRVLAIIARHLDDVPVLIALTSRSDAPPGVADELRRLGEQEIRLDPLAEVSVAELLERSLGAEAAQTIAHDLREATGGNPFLIHESVVAMQTRGWSGLEGDASQLGRLAPESIRRFVLRRLAAAGAAAQDLARSVALLGEAELSQASRLAELDTAEAVAAADRLAAADVLVPGTRLRYVHPILRETVRSDIPAAHRALAHARAARILAEDGATPEQVAVHLVEAIPQSDPWVVETLVEAALRARQRGSPETAAVLLTRALAEPPSAQLRSSIALHLGSIEASLGRPEALSTLDMAIASAQDPAERTHAFLWKAKALFMVLETDSAVALLHEFDRAAAGVDPELALRFEGELIGSARVHPTARTEALARLERLQQLALPPRPATVAILANLTVSAAERNDSSSSVAELAQLALTNGWLLDEGSNQIARVVNSLIWVDRIDEAIEVLADVSARARQTGSLTMAAMAHATRARAHLRRGAVQDAEADARIAHGLAQDQGWEYVIPLTSTHLANALLETGNLNEAEEVLEGAGLAPASRKVPEFLDASGRLHLAKSAPESALEDFLACGRQLAERGGVDAPGVVPWRSHATLALVALGDSERARELSSQELALADASGVYGNIGVALMAHGLALGADSGITWLERAVEALERSPRVIARVEALLALGSMIRRTGQPRAARAHLTKAVDLARRHGARSLCERARVELQAAGGRPRREALTGIEALTASERRVADLAASGLTNRRIAQELFLSPRTVTTHLTHVYQKLGVSGRDQLSDLLEP